MTTIYRVDTPGDESEPVVRSDDPLNQNIDWRYLGSVLEGDNAPDLERLAEVDVHAEAEQPFESLRLDSDILVSDRLANVLKGVCAPDVEFIPILVNGRRFLALLVLTTLDVLDLDRSDVEYFRSTPGRVKRVRRYVFKDGVKDQAALAKATMFKVPQLRGPVFAVESVRQAYLESGIPGLRFLAC